MATPLQLTSSSLTKTGFVNNTKTFTLTFNRNVLLNSINDITISDGKAQYTPKIVSIKGTIVTLSIDNNSVLVDGQYSVILNNGFVKDTKGILNTAKSLPFILDTTTPFVSTMTPNNNASSVPVNNKIVLNFDEKIKLTKIGHIVLDNGNGDVRSILITDTKQVTLSNSQTITLKLQKALLPDSHYTVTLDPIAVTDLAGNQLTEPNMSGFSFNTIDTKPPVLNSSSPANSAIAVLRDSPIVLTFDKHVLAGSGNIIIDNGNGSNQTIDITDKSQVSFDNNATITITPKVPLLANSHYSISIDPTAITDAAGHNFVETSTIAFSFDTIDTLPPLLTTNNASATKSDSSIVLTFNELIQLGTGNITLTIALPVYLKYSTECFIALGKF